MRQSILEEENPADVNRGALHVELHPRPAGGSDDATPVRIGAVNRRLHKWGVRDSPRNLARVVDAARVADLNADQLGRAFAATHDTKRELSRYGEEGLGKSRVELFVNRDAARS